MLTSIIGTKMLQSQEFSPEGKRMPVTSISAGPCFITQIENRPKAKRIQLGFGTMHYLSQAESGHLKKAGLDNKKLRFLRTFTVDEIPADAKPGQEVKIEEIF